MVGIILFANYQYTDMSTNTDIIIGASLVVMDVKQVTHSLKRINKMATLARTLETVTNKIQVYIYITFTSSKLPYTTYCTKHSLE